MNYAAVEERERIVRWLTTRAELRMEQALDARRLDEVFDLLMRDAVALRQAAHDIEAGNEP